MNLLKQLALLDRIDSLIRRKATGTPDEFAEKLDLSRASLYRYLNVLRNAGAIIDYDQQENSFFYVEDFHLDFNCLIN